jgi:hypothetical protein
MPKPPRSAPSRVRVVELLTFPLVQLLDVTGPAQVFASANDVVLTLTQTHQGEVVPHK